MNDVISVQSSVAYGYVGNRAAVFTLETLGFTVIQINTVQFSTHAGYKQFSGEILSAQHIEALFNSLEYANLTQNSTALLSGYLGNVDIGKVLLQQIKKFKAINPNFMYCCDPVMGDTPHGLYVKPEIADFYMHEAMYETDILIPNHFEASYLSGIAIETEYDAKKAVEILHEKGPKIILITSYKASTASNIGFFLSNGNTYAVLETPRIYFSNTPHGTGDLVSALFLGHYLSSNDIVRSLEQTANTVYEILVLTKQTDAKELSLVQGRNTINFPNIQFKVTFL
mgnify:CR=1 FL=1